MRDEIKPWYVYTLDLVRQILNRERIAIPEQRYVQDLVKILVYSSKDSHEAFLVLAELEKLLRYFKCGMFRKDISALILEDIMMLRRMKF